MDYKLLEEKIKTINKSIKVEDDIRAEYIESFTEVSRVFREELNRVDPIFETYQKVINVGSHAINTRVGTPNEFDMNVCIKLPQELYYDIEFKNSARPGYIQIKLSQARWDRTMKNQIWSRIKAIEKWVDGEKYLLESNVRTWMEGKVQNALSNLGYTIKSNGNIYTLSLRKSGPAFTLCVQKQGFCLAFDVDLVPSIVFEHPNWPPNIKQKFANEFSSSTWFAVAKPLKEDEKRFWRPSFSLQEFEILNNSSHMKSAIRLIKKTKESNQLTYIPTYFINTLFMLEKKKMPPSYWNNPVSQIYVEMLIKLQEAFSAKQLPYYWCTSQNLLYNLKPTQVTDADARLTHIINAIKKNPCNIETIICGQFNNTMVHHSPPEQTRFPWELAGLCLIIGSYLFKSNT